MTTVELRAHLTATGLAGAVATSPGHTRANCGKLADGNPDYTFGLSDWHDTSQADAIEAVSAVCGPDAVVGDDEAPGWIDPDATIAAIEQHRAVLSDVAASPCRVLLATGHPTGLLAHYGAIARALRTAGCQVVTPMDDRWLRDPALHGVRFVDGVACVWTGGDLVHTHLSDYAEAMLDAADTSPDLVVGDHGMAGAAIERGIRTLAVADVNDPALFVAQQRGRTHAVLPIDDNLAPRHYVPVTDAVVGGIPQRRR